MSALLRLSSLLHPLKTLLSLPHSLLLDAFYALSTFFSLNVCMNMGLKSFCGWQKSFYYLVGHDWCASVSPHSYWAHIHRKSFIWVSSSSIWAKAQACPLLQDNLSGKTFMFMKQMLFYCFPHYFVINPHLLFKQPLALPLLCCRPIAPFWMHLCLLHVMALCCPRLWLMAAIQPEKFPWVGASCLTRRRNSLLLSVELMEQEGSEWSYVCLFMCMHACERETNFCACQ